MRRILLAALVLVTLLVPLTVTADVDVTDRTIDMNSYYSDPIIVLNSNNEVKVTVTSNSSVDVYIVALMEFLNYPGNFSPEYKQLNTKSTTFTWKVPTTGTYYVIVDNEVNNIPGSATPTGPVVISYHRTGQTIEEAAQAVVWYASILCISVIVVIVVVVVVIVLVVIKLSRKKEQPPQQMYAQPGVPPQPYYQQPPPQQPGQYSPPPPPPQQGPPMSPPSPPQYPPVPPPPGV